MNNEESPSATAIDHSIKKQNQTKTKRRQSDRRQKYGNVNVQSLCHGIFTNFQCHNAYSYISDEKALIVSLLTNCKLVRTPPTVSKNAEVPSWWKGSSKCDSSSFHSMMFEDNVGEDRLSAQSSYTIDINDSNYIDNLAPHPTMFDNEVPLEEDTLKMVYTQLISALNDVRIQKRTNSTLSAMWDGKSQNTFIGQVKASAIVVKSNNIEFFDWSLHNSFAYFWSCDDIGKCTMLKVAIERAIKKSPHYDLAGNLFNVDGKCKHQFVGFVSSYTRFNVLTSFHLHSFVTFYTNSDSNTVATCSLTTRHHILSNMQDCLMQLLQLMQFWKTESFAVSLANKVIGSNVKINQDSIDGYVGLGFDISNFNEDGSGDMYTIGISMPICMVQYCDFFSWSKYCRCLFPNNLSRMTLDNVDELFHQNLIEFLQTDIDGSVDFSLNAITIQSLEKYLKTLYACIGHWSNIFHLGSNSF